MKFKFIAILGLAAFQAVAQNTAPTNTPAATAAPDWDKISYAIGSYFGGRITNAIDGQHMDVNRDTMLTALTDVINGRPSRMTPAEVQETLTEMQTALRAKAVEKNKKDGEDFLANNAKQDGVKTLPSGLQYQVLTEGSGDSPTISDTVTVDYNGKLINGTVFDHGNGTTFPVAGVIKGWTEALQLMKPGAKWRLTIPSDLAYGPNGSPPKIGPYSVLVFDVDLVSVKSASPPVNPVGTSPVVSGEIIKVPSAEGLKKGEKIEVIKAPPGTTNN